MTLSNPWFLAAIVGILGWFHIKLLADLLNLSRLSKEVPEPMKDLVTPEDMEKTAEYHIASTKFSLLREAMMLALLLAFWFAGGFGWLDRWSMGFGLDSIGTGLVLLSALALGNMLISLPFEAWDTFKIEAEFGFNKTTPGTFISDNVKGVILSAVLGLPILAAVLWLLENLPYGFAWAWLAVALFGMFTSWIAPRLIMPMFMKFTPMEDSPLRQAISAPGEKLKFPVQDISIVDGSRRSTKANAFFTGFGKTKRIALFDTLIANHTQDEIVAVLAHEIGHNKLKHVPQQMALGLGMTALMFTLLHFALQDHRLFSAFGVMYPSTAMGLVLFSLVYGPWSNALDPFVQGLSRKHEYQADRFARESVGSAEPMASALKKLSKDHKAHLTPHPFYVWLHYSHPTTLERLVALSS